MALRFDYGTGVQTTNPANPQQVVSQYAVPDDHAIAKIIAQSSKAQQQWARVPALERGDRLNAFLDAVVSRVDDVAQAITLEQGKLLAEAKGETLKGCAEGRFMVGEAARMGSTPIGTGRPTICHLAVLRIRAWALIQLTQRPLISTHPNTPPV